MRGKEVGVCGRGGGVGSRGRGEIVAGAHTPMFVTLLTSQPLRSPLNEVAHKNMP